MSVAVEGWMGWQRVNVLMKDRWDENVLLMKDRWDGNVLMKDGKMFSYRMWSTTGENGKEVDLLELLFQECVSSPVQSLHNILVVMDPKLRKSFLLVSKIRLIWVICGNQNGFKVRPTRWVTRALDQNIDFDLVTLVFLFFFWSASFPVSIYGWLVNKLIEPINNYLDNIFG